MGEVRLAEVLPERRAEQAARFGIARTYASLDELCGSDVDAVALFTQRWLHGPQAVRALEAGKHVYSAVPAAVTRRGGRRARQGRRAHRPGLHERGDELLLPSVLYCRDRFARGDFGRFVYGEA